MAGRTAPPPGPDETRRARRALLGLNFFMADMQAGVGPFLPVFLAAHHWRPAPIGLVMTLGGLAGMAVVVPAGALVDRSRHKATLIVASGACTIAASAAVFLSQTFWVVATSQAATAIAGAAIGPAVAGLTLGVVRQAGFNAQNGRNQASNHAGNMAGAALSGLLGWTFGLSAVLGLAAAFGAFSIASVLMIPRGAVDHAAARGLEGEEEGRETPKGFGILPQCRPLLILALCLLLFHLGNAGLLPLYGLAVSQSGRGNPAVVVASTIVTAQAVMVPMSLAAMRLAGRRGYWGVILISFAALPVRGLLAASVITGWGVFPVQALDGVGAGLQSVAVPGVVTRLTRGTGRVNAAQGAVMTAQGLGAAASPALSGWLAQRAGYPISFTALGAIGPHLGRPVAAGAQGHRRGQRRRRGRHGGVRRAAASCSEGGAHARLLRRLVAHRWIGQNGSGGAGGGPCSFWPPPQGLGGGGFGILLDDVGWRDRHPIRRLEPPLASLHLLARAAVTIMSERAVAVFERVSSPDRTSAASESPEP